ncbi:MAG: abortive infection protein [Ktedonobacterales bacterium]
MKRKGVTYDVGSVMGMNWRPDYDPEMVHRELEIIKNDLHCTAVRICGHDLGRLAVSAEDALKQGLEVWLYPELWNKSQEQTLSYMTKAAARAEPLRERWPDHLVFVAGGELTLFMQGIVAGKTFMKRLRNALSGEAIKEGKHNKPLNAYLSKANAAVRQVFHGPVTYCSLIWEQVDWSLFDFVGVDHYWSARIKDRYLDMLRPLFAFGKPVIITEFGFGTTRAEPVGGAFALGNVDNRTRFLDQLPLVGRFIRPRLSKIDERDEGMQARRLIDQLTLLDSAGVDGAFISTFVFPLNPYDDTPKYDLDRESASLVKSYTDGRHGTTYPNMPWEPKESFKAVADYYAAH